MASFCSIVTVLLLVLAAVNAYTIGTYYNRGNEPPVPVKRLSNEALIRLLMRNRSSQFVDASNKRDVKRAEVERRSIDEDFNNCFLSPVQCMLPSNRR